MLDQTLELPSKMLVTVLTRRVLPTVVVKKGTGCVYSRAHVCVNAPAAAKMTRGTPRTIDTIVNPVRVSGEDFALV